MARLKAFRVTLGLALLAIGFVLACIPDDWIETVSASARITAMASPRPRWRVFQLPRDAFSPPTCFFPPFAARWSRRSSAD
jgi:hypothetical protein